MIKIRESDGGNTWYVIDQKCLMTKKGEIHCTYKILKVFYTESKAVIHMNELRNNKE